MTRQAISIGSSANDGTGDTLRQAAQKINETFVEIYQKLGGDSDVLAAKVTLEDSAVVFEGATVDAFETRLSVVNPTADRLVQIPNASGFIVLDNTTQTLTNKTITSPTITTPIIGTGINDTNGNEIIKLTATTSAVNEFTVINAATAGSPTISATGTDTNVGMALVTKGNGSVAVDKISYPSVEISVSGAASQTVSYIVCNRVSALAVSLADGTTVGEVKIFTNKGTGVATITPANFAQGTSFALDQWDAATVIWDGNNWFITGHYGATVS